MHLDLRIAVSRFLTKHPFFKFPHRQEFKQDRRLLNATDVVCFKRLTNYSSRYCLESSQHLVWIVLRSSLMPEEPKLGKKTLSLPALPALPALPVLAAIGVAVAIVVGGTAQQESAQGQHENAQGQYENAHPVPDGGSTVALLGFSVVLLALSQRKIARPE